MILYIIMGVFVLAIIFFLRYSKASIEQQRIKNIVVEQNQKIIDTIKSEVESLNIPMTLKNSLWNKDEKDKLRWPLSHWNIPESLSYFTYKELEPFELFHRIIPICEDYMIWAYDKKKDSFLEFHIEDTKAFDDYPKQNWQQFITNHFFKWYWDYYLEEEKEEVLNNIKHTAILLEYEHLDHLMVLLDNNLETDYNVLLHKIEDFKAKL